LDADGRATNLIPRHGSIPVNVVWNLALDGSEQISGTISAETWSAELLGDRAVFSAATNPCPMAGKYTLIFAGSSGATTSPEGDGFATALVDQNGLVTLKGRLAEASVVAQKVPLSRNGMWPLFVPLYSKTGAILSWVQFEDLAESDFHGTATWLKPFVPLSLYFPAGFNIVTEISGSRFVPSANALGFQTGKATFTGGNLEAVHSNIVALGANNKISTQGGELLTGSIVPATGLLTGTFKPVGVNRPISVKGAVFQKANYASGYFLGTSQSGRFVIQPAQ
jgi:hypothetical protein